MDNSEIYRKLVDALGGQASAARSLGVSQPSVNGWVHGNHGMSAKIALRAERVTCGAIKAVDLCPDLAISDDSAA